MREACSIVSLYNTLLIIACLLLTGPLISRLFGQRWTLYGATIEPSARIILFCNSIKRSTEYAVLALPCPI